MMRSFRQIKADYDFTDEDARRLAGMKDTMEEHLPRIMEALHSWMLGNRDVAAFFTDETRMNKVWGLQEAWFRALFGGAYDSAYFERLVRVGYAHVKAGVDAHYLGRAVNIVRNSCVDVLCRCSEDCEQYVRSIVALEKLIDINLDVITSAYLEEELRVFSAAARVKTVLIGFSERFTQSMNVVLILALMGLTVGVVGLFVYDIVELFSGELNHGIITALGNLLILWIMIELMNNEVRHLKGGKFRVNVFVGVALVAIIRDTMILTVKHEDYSKLPYFVALILVLGVVFWLVTRSEERSN